MHLKSIIVYNGNHYYVSSNYTFDHGYETMIFACDSNGDVKNWAHLYQAIYESFDEMEKNHNEIIAHPEEYI